MSYVLEVESFVNYDWIINAAFGYPNLGKDAFSRSRVRNYYICQAQYKL